MSPNPFDPTFDQLPGSLPIFPLTGVLLLPRSRLPLNVFEPRYLAMTEDALASGNRLIGMVQPIAAEEAARPPPVYRTGCAGRITSFSETDDGRYLITLSGVCRFDIAEEMPTTRGYRRVAPDWAPYRTDLSGPESSAMLDRARLLSGLKGYFRQTGLTANWEAVESTPDERLVNSLAMICPFDASEKQALLEAPTLEERARMMTAMMEMAVLDPHDGDTVSRH
jgi:uncharacterized protein